MTAAVANVWAFEENVLEEITHYKATVARQCQNKRASFPSTPIAEVADV